MIDSHSGRKIVYWGTGTICRMFLDAYPEIDPEFFIDSYASNKVYNGKPVLHPLSVSDWREIYVVIVNTAVDAVERVLREKGLRKNTDYQIYTDFFSLDKGKIADCLEKVKALFNDGELETNCELVYAPFFHARNAHIIQNFFQRQSAITKCIGIANYMPYSESRAKAEMGFPIIQLPWVCRWDGIVRNSYDLDNENYLGNIDAADASWIEELGRIKQSTLNESDFYSKLILFCLSELIQILQPSRIVIWGGWMRASLVLEYLAKKHSIPFVFAEWGWIPGTIQFDPVGIAGRSQYAKNMDMKKLFCNEELSIDDSIYNYLLVKQSQRIASIDADEEKKINCLLSNGRKTVLFVGMGDLGMGIKSDSSFWKENVSAYVKSTVEAVDWLAEICEKKEYNLIFKPHPEQTTIAEESVKKKSVLRVSNTSVEKLIDTVDVVVSIASAVDYMVLMHEKPLVQLGETGMNFVECTYKVTQSESLENQLEKAIRDGVTESQKSNYKKYITYLLNHYLWDDMTHVEFPYGRKIEEDLFSN